MATSLSLPPYNFLIINFLTFSLFFLFLVKKSNNYKNNKIFFFYGWLFGFGYFFTNLYWISISLTFDQNFQFLIPITIIFIPAFFALFYGLVAYFFIILKPKKNYKFIFIFFLNFWSSRVCERIYLNWFSLELNRLQFFRPIRNIKYYLNNRNLWI